MGFPRSEESFVAVLGLCYTPDYFWMIVSQYPKTAHLRESDIQPLTFRLTRFGPGFAIRVSLSCSDDASNTHSFRGHDSQLAEVAAADLRFIHITPRFTD